MNKHRSLKVISTLALMVLLLVGCDRRPLELLVEEEVRVKLVLKWKVRFQAIYKTQPTGMTVMLWPDGANAPQVNISNSDSILLRLEPQRYRMIVFNQTFSEFPYLEFHNVNSFENFSARGQKYMARNWDSGTAYMHYPDPIGVAVDTFYITEDMVQEDTTIFVYYDDYKRDNTSLYSERVRYYEIPEVPTPMTVTLYVKGKVKRPQSIKHIEASISGMADGFYMSRVDRTTESTTQFLPDTTWTFTPYGESTDSMAYVSAKLPSFGLPHGKELLAERDSADNILTFNITLSNDSVITLPYKVGKSIHYLRPTGEEAQIRNREDLHDLRLEVDLTETIVVPGTPSRSASGFDARVDEWEDGGTIDMGGF